MWRFQILLKELMSFSMEKTRKFTELFGIESLVMKLKDTIKEL